MEILFTLMIILLAYGENILLYFWVKKYYFVGIRLKKYEELVSISELDNFVIEHSINKESNKFTHKMVCNRFDNKTYGIREKLHLMQIRSINKKYYTPMLRGSLKYDSENSKIIFCTIIGLRSIFILTILSIFLITATIISFLNIFEEPMLLLIPIIILPISIGIVFSIINIQNDRYEQIFKTITSRM